MTEHHHRERTGWRFPPERRHALWDEEREKRMPPGPVLEASGIASGDTVIDVGAGTGYWTLPLSTLVGPGGRVIAVDVEPLMVDELHALVHERRLRNVDVVSSEELHIPLESGIADAALLSFILHEPPDPAAFVREVARLLKPKARVLVLDWHKWETEEGPPFEHKLAVEETRALLGEEGFSLQEIRPPREDVYFVLGIRGRTEGPKAT
jgi:ubiquinone/menaquinone biosynthesis C-methylase UbiE